MKTFCFCILDIDDNFTVSPVKRLTFDKGEHLESHTWSSNDEIFAVAGHKIYLFEVSPLEQLNILILAPEMGDCKVHFVYTPGVKVSINIFFY